MNILPGNMRFGAGQPVKRLEDQRLLTGKGQFIDDKPEDGALWLHVLRSPHAHAKIVSIDTKAAADMPGVEAVYTGADLIADNIGSHPDAVGVHAAGRQADDGAAAPPARPRDRALCRRAGRGRGGDVARCGADRGRSDLGRIRSLAVGGRSHRSNQTRRAGGVGGGARQHRRRHELWRCRRGRSRVRQGRA